MIYLELERSAEQKITGIKDGTTQSYLSKDFFDKNPEIHSYIISNRANYFSGILPENDKNLIGLPLCKGAKVTDFISVGGLLGLVMSSKLKDIFEKANLPKHKFFPTSFIFEDKPNIHLGEYWWLLYELERGENIDFVESKFEISENDKNEFSWLKHFEINNIEDYEKVRLEIGTAAPASKLVFKSSFNTELDIWGTYPFANRCYISDRLVEKLKMNKITNYEVVNPLKKYLMPIVPPCELIFK